MGTPSYHDERGGCGDWCGDGVSIHRETPKGAWDLTIETLVNMEYNFVLIIIIIIILFILIMFFADIIFSSLMY